MDVTIAWTVQTAFTADIEVDPIHYSVWCSRHGLDPSSSSLLAYLNDDTESIGGHPEWIRQVNVDLDQPDAIVFRVDGLTSHGRGVR